ncbi:multidrug transporter [uncultured archaeon]|nr:multidrug transporter [uncultured archaeon]
MKSPKVENHEGITIGILAFMGILITYVETMITPALPVFVNVFNTNYDTLSWVLTAYIITGTTAAALFGKLADIVGKKKIFLSLAIVYALAVSFGGFVNTIGELIAVRAVQGLGFGMFPIAFAVLNDQVPRERLALAQGIISSTFAGGSAVGLVGGAYITQNFGWEWSYHSAIPLAFGLVIFAALFLKDYSVPRKEKIDFLGIGSLAIGLTTLIFGLSEGQYLGWSSPEIIGIFSGSLLSFIVFAWAESHVEKPFIDINLLKIRNVFLANFTGLFALAALFFLFYSIPPLLQDPSPAGFGQSIFRSGLVLLPASILTMVFASVAAKVTTNRGPKVAILIGSIILFFAYLGLLFNRGSIVSISEDSAILGIGMSFIFVGVINILLISIPVSRSGEATGMNVVFRNIGMSIAPAIGGVLETVYTTNVVVGYLPYKLGQLPVVPIMTSFPSTRAFDSIYLVGIVFLVAAIIFTLMMKNIIVGKGR